MQNKTKTQMESEDLGNLNKTYIPKILNVLQNTTMSQKVQQDLITRILNVYLKENVNYEYAVEQICFCVKECQRQWENRNQENCYQQRNLKDALRKFLFGLIKKRGLMNGKNFQVSIKERKPHEKKLNFKCEEWEIPREYMKLVPDTAKIKRMLDEKGSQEWVDYDPDFEFSLWITKPRTQYATYRPRKYYY